MTKQKILMIAPSFYNYYLDLKKEFESRGYEVHWWPDQVYFSPFGKMLNKLFRNRASRFLNGLVKRILNKERDSSFDLLVLINGKSLSRKNVISLLDGTKNKKSIYYAWDSIASFPNIVEFYSLFDRRFSFDPMDCEKYDMSFLPLFYAKKESSNQRQYDCCSIMNVYPAKVDGLENVLSSLPKELSCYFHHRIQSRLSFFYYKHKYNCFRKYSIKDFKYTELSREECDRLFLNSRVVLDIPLSTQRGLTIRTIQALAYQCKLITTNSLIKTYDFYDEQNIFVVEKDSVVPKSFFSTPFNMLKQIPDQYSVTSFVDKLIN